MENYINELTENGYCVIPNILNEEPSLLKIYNRTYDKAKNLCEKFKDIGKIEAVKKDLSNKDDFTSDEILSKYNQKHQRSTRPLYYGTNLLVDLYNSEKLSRYQQLNTQPLLEILKA